MKHRLALVAVWLTASASALAAGPAQTQTKCDVGELANAPIDVRQLVEDLGRLLNAYSNPLVIQGTDLGSLSNEDGIITRQAFQDWARTAGDFDQDDAILGNDANGRWKSAEIPLFDKDLASADDFAFDFSQHALPAATAVAADSDIVNANVATGDRGVLATLNVQSFGVD